MKNIVIIFDSVYISMVTDHITVLFFIKFYFILNHNPYPLH